jgi:hypothetical protein
MSILSDSFMDSDKKQGTVDKSKFAFELFAFLSDANILS